MEKFWLDQLNKKISTIEQRAMIGDQQAILLLVSSFRIFRSESLDIPISKIREILDTLPE